LGIRKVSRPVSPNSTVNCTEKKSPSPQTQESATLFPQSRVLRKRKPGEEMVGVAMEVIL
jgi:hypothetical protein